MEQWRRTIGFIGYEVSDQGRVRSYWNQSHGLQSTPKKILKASPAKNGYLRVSLRAKGKTIYVNVHTLVARAFIGERPYGYEVRHLNGNKEDARLSNLDYGTMVENHADRVRLGEDVRGAQVGTAVLSEDSVKLILKMLDAGVPQAKIASEHGVGQMTVSNIKTGKTWKHVPRGGTS